jgi:hypothetical protein
MMEFMEVIVLRENRERILGDEMKKDGQKLD